MTAAEEDRLRQENQGLRELVSQLQEKITLQEEQISAQQQQIAALTQQLQHLQARQQKDSHNSHLPPSSDRFGRQAKTRSLRKRSGKPPGGQQGHEGQTLRLVDEPDQVIVHEVQRCAHCQQDLHAQASLSGERRQVIDLPPKRVLVIEHQAQSKCCPRCGQLTQAAFPEDVCAPVQYGPAFGALAVYLVEQQLLPYARASEVLQDLLGHSMSVGTIENLIGRCARGLEPVEQLIKHALSQSAVMHQDETGFYLAGKRVWLHVSCTSSLTRLSGPCQARQRSPGGHWHPEALYRNQCA